MYPSCESPRSPGRLSPSAQQNFLSPTSPPNFPPPPSPPLEAGGNSRGYGDLLEAGYYNPQEDTTPPDYPPSPAGLVATVGVGELQDERLDSLHCIPLDLPSSPQPVFISCKPIYDLSLSIVTKSITITIIITITHVHMITFFLPSFPLSLFLLSFQGSLSKIITLEPLSSCTYDMFQYICIFSASVEPILATSITRFLITRPITNLL